MNTNFFVAGGTLRHDSPSYVKRQADDQLFQAILAGHYCYVLTARQMGKSSLMVRTARRLQQQGILTAVIDLTAIGTDVSPAQWYLGLLMRLQAQLRLPLDVRAWWTAQQELGVVQRFTLFLSEGILQHTTAPVVILIDEIDTTLNLPFSDDFFAAVRAIYNERAADPAYNRLTFVFLGVATPADLIKDPGRTPFNIGQEITLQEFTQDEASILAGALSPLFPQQGEALFQRIFWWTNGHPYLTQRLCLALTETKEPDVDTMVRQMFLADEAQGETNIQFVNNKILQHPQKNALLKLYRKVYRGDDVAEDQQSLLQNHLKLSGLVQAREGYLQVRNPIYRQVFDQAWLQAHTAVSWTPFLLIFTLLLTILAVGSLLYDNTFLPQQAQAQEKAFRQAETAATRTAALSHLLTLQPLWGTEDAYTTIALDLFFGLPDYQTQADLFAQVEDAATLNHLVSHLYIAFAQVDDDQQTNALLPQISQALGRFPHDPTSVQLQTEIDLWIEARLLASGQAWTPALEQYNAAVRLNNSNPATLYERAALHARLGSYRAAAQDLENILALAVAAGQPLPTATATPLPTIGPLPTSPFRNAVDITTTTRPIIPALPTRDTPTPAADPPLLTPLPLQPPPTAAIAAQFATRSQRINAIRALITTYPALGDMLTAAPPDTFPHLRLTGLIPSLTSRLLYLPFDEPVQTTQFTDRSGYNHHGQCFPPACPTAGVTGHINGAIQLDGVDDYITLRNPDTLHVLNQITLAAWIQPQATDGLRNIIAHGHSREPDGEIIFRVNEGLYQVGAWDGADHLAAYPIPTADIGQWVHLAGVYDGTAWRLYHNGIEVSVTADAVGAIFVNGAWAVGARGTGTERFFQGAVDEVMLYNRALTAVEIWTLYTR